MAIFDISEKLTFISRTVWHGNSNLPRLGALVDRRRRSHVILHHTVTPDSDKTPNIWEDRRDIVRRMRQLQTIRPDLGLDVPYNFVAFITAPTRLTICEGRGEDRAGAHTKGHNSRGVAVAFAGDFERLSTGDIDMAAQMDNLGRFLRWLRRDPSHPSYGRYPPMHRLGTLRPAERQVFLHRDFKSTACPGKTLSRYADKIDFLNSA